MTRAPQTRESTVLDHPLNSTIVLVLVACVAAAIETLAVRARVGAVRGNFGLSSAVFIQAAFGALVLGRCLHVALRAWRRLARELPWQESFAAHPRNTAVDLAQGVLFVAPTLILLARTLLLVLLHYSRNVELIALLGGFVLLLLGSLAAPLIVLSTSLARRVRARLGAPAHWLPWLPVLVLWSKLGIVVGRESGLEQLDAWIFLSAAASLVALFAALGLVGRLRTARDIEFPFALVSVASFGAVALASNLLQPSATPALADQGAWSRPVIAIVRTLTDFDGDGYSSWLAGGDCAPFDAAVHPGAVEIPRDGTDNDCLGGDATPASAPPTPKPSGLKLLAGQPLNLVLVTIETLRADHVSFLGYSRWTTPVLSALAARSTVFETSYAAAPGTRLSLAALLSGLPPSKIHWLPQEPAMQMRRIADDTPWLPSELQRRGYATLAVHTDFRAFTRVENAGFDRGFTRYDTTTHLEFQGGTMHGFPGQAQIDRALTLVDEVERGPARGHPLFLWVHLVEPHYLYEQSPAVATFGNDERSLYDAEIAEADRQVGRLLSGLQARGLLEHSVVLVSGDHGEEFREHGQRWHNSNLYEPQLRTATLLFVPGLPARRVTAAVSNIDFAPTLLDLLAVDADFSRLMGRNLLPLLASGAVPAPRLIAETFTVDRGQHSLYALIEPPYKLIFDRDAETFELFDVRTDRLERDNLYAPNDPRARRMKDALMRYIESAAPAATSAAASR